MGAQSFTFFCQRWLSAPAPPDSASADLVQVDLVGALQFRIGVSGESDVVGRPLLLATPCGAEHMTRSQCLEVRATIRAIGLGENDSQFLWYNRYQIICFIADRRAICHR